MGRWGGGIRCAALLLGAAVLALPWAPGARAAGPSPGFGLRPALSGETTLPDGHFTYALPAGGAVADAFVVQSGESVPLQLSVYGADLLAASGGGFTPAPQGSSARSVGGWLALAPGPALPPRGEARVPFTLTVPAGTAPGSYDGAVVAAGTAPAAQAAAVGLRVALIVHVVVVGSAQPALGLGSLTAAGPPGAEAVALQVRNTGNVNLGLGGSLRLRAPDGAAAGTVPLGPPGLYVVPGGSAELHGTLVWPRGASRLTATPELQTTVGSAPGPVYSGAPQALARPGASPWAGAALAAVLAAVALAFFAGGRRHPRGRPARRAPP